MIPTPDKLFAQYQRTGDPADLAEVFDATAPKLLLLAIHLTGDEVGAEDLVQDTFVKAIENAQSYDSERPFLPWVSTILSNEARRAWRDSRRDPGHDRVLREVTDDPHRVAAEADTIEVLTEAIEGLDETYRAVVRLKVVHGMKPGEIAKVLSISPELARTRLSRGLKQLRAALPATLAGSLMVMIGGRGLAQVRARVLERAAAVQQSAAVTATSSPAWLGYLTLASAVVIGLVGWFVVSGSDGDEHDALASPAAETSELAGLDSTARPLGDAAHRVSAAGGSAAPADSFATGQLGAAWTLSGTVRSQGAPLAGARVDVALLHGRDLERLDPCFTGDDGRYELDVDELRKLGDLGLIGAGMLIDCSAPGHWPHPVELLDAMPADTSQAARFVQDLELTPGRTMHAKLRSASGERVTGTSTARLVDIRLESSRRWHHFEEGEPVLVPVRGHGPWRFEVQCDDGILALPLPQLPPDGDLGELTVAEHHVVQGRFVVTGGHPVPHALFELRRTADPAPSAKTTADDDLLAPTAETSGRSDAHGRFRVTGLVAGDYRLHLDHGDVGEVEAVLSTDTAPIDIVLEGQSLTVRTLDKNGRLVPGLRLLYEWELDGERRTGDLGINDQGGVFDFLVPFGSRWRFSSGSWLVSFPVREHFASAGEPHATLDILIDGPAATGPLRLDVRGPGGEALDHYALDLYHLESEDYAQTLASDDPQLERMPLGRYRGTLRCPASAPDDAVIFSTQVVELKVATGSPEEHTVDVALGCHIELHVDAPPGLLNLTELYLQVRRDGEWFHAGGFTQADRNGRLTPASFDLTKPMRSIAVFPPGELHLRVINGTLSSSAATCELRAGRITQARVFFERS
jgi:RNA polymerase sigma factor (sigma-70 family)